MESFKGVSELIASLQKFPTNIQNNVMTGAIRAGTKPLVTAIKSNINEDTKNLKKSIGVIKRKSKDKTKVRFSVTARRGGKNNGWYMHMVEFGTSKMAATPVFRPAFENQGNQSLEASKKYLRERIDKEILKAKK